MVSGVEWELEHQKKMLEMLTLMLNDIELLKKSFFSSNSNIEAVDPLLGSVTKNLEQLIENANYYFEMTNCKQIMLNDSIEKVKELEGDIEELKLQIRSLNSPDSI